jgi:K(+)-stimulated pyrophosphate-energized sodium pump
MTMALVLLLAPGTVPAQEPASKEAVPPAAPAAAPATTQPAATQPEPSGVLIPPTEAPSAAKELQLFGFWNDPAYGFWEKAALLVVLGIAIAGLVYAVGLVNQVIGADQGTERMREIAAAIREGAKAYLIRQFRAIIPLVIVLTILIWATTESGSASAGKVALGRAAAFFVGAFFSWLVGIVGMSLAVRGNLRVAAAARTSYGSALQLGYRTGTITGMLTDGLGLLGGTAIFMAFGEHAYEVLLGFGFGGTLLALFMRVGGGIYTKAADVGADLVGKVEAGIPEDDPRNAATIADNVGDNVGDCAGMAADIFESYEVTIVAAMILGYASFGHKGVIFPLLVRAIGVLGSIWSTSTVKAGPNSSSDEALHSVHRGFVLGSIFSVVGFVLLGLFYLHFNKEYYDAYPQAVNGLVNNALPWWAGFGISGLDMRPAWTCLIGIVLAITLNKVTSYYTHTQYSPVKLLAKACQTGHATNIIQGFGVGYESAVVSTLVIAVAILLSALIYAGATPIFVAYGVAMCGIGMLTLTGNTISMDVFGPVADNANGIGEMGYDREEMGEENYKRARQILADLDAVGNTTKAETKGIAIGSAVIAAVSLFASFIAVIAVGSENLIGQMTLEQYTFEAGNLSVAYPRVFIGALIGGVVPFLFSSMLIRAVGRAAFLIVKECRVQFRDQEIWSGTKKPDYGRVVNICTAAAQAELIGPALLAILMPILVGIFLGTQAMGGFLAGMIIVGQLLAVFMANAGGAWDNAKKSIEDGLYGGKGSEAHKAAVTGDTVGDPLKDTAGPALNPLIKVMNMVSLLAIVPILDFSQTAPIWLRVVGFICIAGVAWSVWRSKTESKEFREMEAELGSSVEASKSLETVGSGT